MPKDIACSVHMLFDNLAKIASRACPPNNPSSAARRTGRHDCNREAPAGLGAAALGQAFLERRDSFHEWRVSESIEPTNRQILKLRK